jgi:Na+/H+-dicarboxylate symporter
MLVIPMIFVMIVSAIASTRGMRRLGSLGARTAVCFVAMMALAVATGMVLGSLLQPGAGVAVASAPAPKLAAALPPADQVLAVVPANIVDSLAHGDLVAILFFAILFGIGVVAAGDSGRPTATLFQSLMAVLIKIVGLIMETAPVGVFALTATAVGAGGIVVFGAMFKLAVAVLVGSLFLVAVHVGLARLAGLRPLFFLRGIASPMLIAFSSTSSAVTLPASLNAAEVNLGLGEMVPSVVLPLGVVVGKSGAAMFMGLVAMFSAQALHVPLSPERCAIIGASALLMAMSTPSVPSGSLMTLAGVITVVGASDAQAALILALVLPFDRPLDMLRSVPNVTGGLAVAAVVSNVGQTVPHPRP